MHKELHILGLLLARPRTGYDLHRIVVAHGELFADLKKGNVYYLLERLAEAGALTVTTEGGARGPRRERLVYALTEQGRRRFHELLRDVVRTYEPPHSGVEVGMIFLPYLDLEDAIGLLEERHEAVRERRALVEQRMSAGGHLHEQLARDHLLCLMDAELTWIARALHHLRESQREESSAPGGTAAPHAGARADETV